MLKQAVEVTVKVVRQSQSKESLQPTIDKARKRIPFQFDRILSLRMTMTMTNMSTTNTNTNANADTNTGMNIALPFPFTLFCCDYFPIQKKVKINSQTP